MGASQFKRLAFCTSWVGSCSGRHLCIEVEKTTPHSLALAAFAAFQSLVLPQLRAAGFDLERHIEHPSADGSWHRNAQDARLDIQSGIDHVLRRKAGLVPLAARIQPGVVADFADFGLKKLEISKANQRIATGSVRPQLSLQSFITDRRVVSYLVRSDALYQAAAQLQSQPGPNGKWRTNPDGHGGELVNVYVSELQVPVIRLESALSDPGTLLSWAST